MIIIILFRIFSTQPNLHTPFCIGEACAQAPEIACNYKYGMYVIVVRCYLGN